MKKMCCNCLHGGTQFKLSKVTHLHCNNPKEYNQEKYDKGEFCAWDTLRKFSDKCNDFEEKPKTKN